MKGFTLIELMVVIAVIAVLATISLFGLSKAQASARDVSRQQIMSGVRVALERYYADKGSYPTGVPANDWVNATSGLMFTLVPGGYLSAVPSDPCNGGTTILAGGGLTGSVCSPVSYAYANGAVAGATCTPGASGYTLTLTKEAGGKSYFCSPL